MLKICLDPDHSHMRLSSLHLLAFYLFALFLICSALSSQGHCITITLVPSRGFKITSFESQHNNDVFFFLLGSLVFSKPCTFPFLFLWWPRTETQNLASSEKGSITLNEPFQSDLFCQTSVHDVKWNEHGCCAHVTVTRMNDFKSTSQANSMACLQMNQHTDTVTAGGSTYKQFQLHSHSTRLKCTEVRNKVFDLWPLTINIAQSDR